MAPAPRIRSGAISIEKASENANDHEQRARVHPALPSYSVVVPAPELSSIDVAVQRQMGTIMAFDKGGAQGFSNLETKGPNRAVSIAPSPISPQTCGG